eukprot:967458-Prymnesium_polylepis.3
MRVRACPCRRVPPRCLVDLAELNEGCTRCGVRAWRAVAPHLDRFVDAARTRRQHFDWLRAHQVARLRSDGRKSDAHAARGRVSSAGRSCDVCLRCVPHAVRPTTRSHGYRLRLVT